ncbi:MAG TPA: hypothetical protein PKD19_03025 [Candidatus Saccharibacteria bacterium]|jgi:hypothetical protein|nr:hypothetical protein [Candidatus Saccharibacteria bacterium]HMR37993.1 hypothetical protein [Candidatus Saccharibacteria bacterium]
MIYSGKRFFYFGIYAAMWNKLFRRDIVLPNIISIDPAIQVGEDGLTTYASFLDASTVVVLKDTLYHYRDDNATSLTRSYRYEQFDSALLLIASLRRIASQHQDTYDLNPQIDIYLLYNIWSIMLEEFYYKTKRPYRHRYQYLNRIVTHPTVQKACDSVLQQDVLGSEQTKFFRLFAPGRFHTLLGATVRNSIDRRINHYTRSTIYGSKPLMASARLISKAKNLAQPSHARVR